MCVRSGLGTTTNPASYYPVIHVHFKRNEVAMYICLLQENSWAAVDFARSEIRTVGYTHYSNEYSNED